MKRVFSSIKRIMVIVFVMLVPMCTVLNCGGSKKVPEKASTLDADQEKFRRDVFDKETR